ncbi:50S ribosomal protein L35 [Striga asiatica]|uniref:50S ribosomal protein L35 n=1 Tax=Striga asiatica TaxID=4170 RepID=A0A5A7PBT8_STRAF|nr:50S ribosomal protein L35 [Striga asiatica]
MIRKWCSRLRLAAAINSIPKAHHHHHRQPIIPSRLLHTCPNFPQAPRIFSQSLISPNFKPLLSSPPFPQLCHSPIALTQVRYITAKQRKRKLKSRKPMTPVVSKVKKIKIKGYSSFKGRFRVMNDGQIRRWKEGKRHNAFSKSKKSKRRLRQPGVVPLAYAKVMKKLNFCY